MRGFLEEKLRGFFIAGVEIERNGKSVIVIVKTARPGILIGRSGEGAARLKTDLEKMLAKKKIVVKDMRLIIEDVRSPESNAAVVSQMVVEDLERRMPFRRILKQTIEKVMANRDVKGVRIAVAGRLGGADMSRTEELRRGRIPLQTLRADVEFARARARLPYGTIGVKVWIYKGDIFNKEKISNS